MSLLTTQECFRVTPEMKIPEPGSSGINGDTIESNYDAFTIGSPPNLMQGELLMSSGFIQIPRSLLNHPTVLGAPIAQRWVLLMLIEGACFIPTVQDDHGKLISLNVGQIMITRRGFADHINVTSNDVYRALERFESVQILSQQVIHKKTIVTIIHSDTYNLIKNEVNQGLSLKRAKSEPENNTGNKGIKKKENTPSSYSLSAQALLRFFQDELKKDWPLAKTFAEKEAAHFEKLLQVYPVDLIKKVIAFAMQDEFWKGKIQSPRKLVVGSADNPDRFQLLLSKLKQTETVHERTQKFNPKPAHLSIPRANELCD